MKNLIILTIALISITLSAQTQVAKLHFKDGKTITGLAKIRTDEVIKFKTHGKGKVIIYNHKIIKGLDIRQNGQIFNYRYKFIKEVNSIPRLMIEVINEGKVNLYMINVFSGVNHLGHSYNSFIYYVNRSSNDTVTEITRTGSLSGKKFRKAASEYFKDCSNLVEKIENKTFKKRDMWEVVNYYNTQCNIE